MISYLIIDLETNTVLKYGRKANPWYNNIVAVGLCQEGKATSLYTNTPDIDLSDVDVIIGHNLTFDLLYLWKYTWLQDFFKKGGKVFCTQLVEYLLTGHETKFASLRTLAVEKYGCPEREKKMEPYWDAGKQTSEIPEAIVLEDVENDVLDTEQIFLKQYKEAEERGLLKLIEHRMDGLLACIECEYNGMQIDLDRLETNKKELERRLALKQKELYEMIKEVWK